MNGDRFHWTTWASGLTALVTMLILYFQIPRDARNRYRYQHFRTRSDSGKENGPPPVLPTLFFDKNVYSPKDFENEAGIKPTYWGQNKTKNGLRVWGPCYPPSESLDWNDRINRYQSMHHYSYDRSKFKLGKSQVLSNTEGLSGLCRPGFLIIGQGKCGTSSLYHYLVGHPRVVPASEKQIHYFKYFDMYPMQWYLSHFPNAESYLSSGALMTGEASPGYLPYPNVVELIARRMPGPKIICLGRDPLDRSWSSYRYNYVNPAIEMFRKGRVKGVPRGLSDNEYKKKYLYSFEDMLKAELSVLKDCLAPGGIGSTGANSTWGTHAWGRNAIQERERLQLPPLIDIDGQCYGKKLTGKDKVPRKQWIQLAREKPGKFLKVKNIHLSQAMIGRSLYVYPLEWWYAMFPKEDIYFMCTEELRDLSGKPMNELAQFLGLPQFNFTGVLSAGMYNVGGHKGYDKVTSWEEVKEEHGSQKESPEKEEIPISESFKKEMLEFYKPHNERLFQLVGRRCNWSE